MLDVHKGQNSQNLMIPLRNDYKKFVIKIATRSNDHKNFSTQYLTVVLLIKIMILTCLGCWTLLDFELFFCFGISPFIFSNFNFRWTVKLKTHLELFNFQNCFKIDVWFLKNIVKISFEISQINSNMIFFVFPFLFSDF